MEKLQKDLDFLNRNERKLYAMILIIYKNSMYRKGVHGNHLMRYDLVKAIEYYSYGLLVSIMKKMQPEQLGSFLSLPRIEVHSQITEIFKNEGKQTAEYKEVLENLYKPMYDTKNRKIQKMIEALERYKENNRQ